MAPRLAAPIPGATGVSLATRTLVLTGDDSAIEIGSTGTGHAIATTPTALPEPLPSPIASPQFSGASYSP